jgi:ribosomal protein S25
VFQQDRARLHALGRRGVSAIKLHDILQKQPVVTVPRLMSKFGFTAPTANSALAVLIEQGIAREITGYRRNRVFSYAEYLRTLNEGTEV